MSYARNLSRLSRAGVPAVNSLQDIRDLTIYDGLYPLGVIARGHSAANDGGGGYFNILTGEVPGTLVDDDWDMIVFTGGDGSAAALRARDDGIDVSGITVNDPSAGAANAAALTAAWNMCVGRWDTVGPRLNLPAGFIYCDNMTWLWSNVPNNFQTGGFDVCGHGEGTVICPSDTATDDWLIDVQTQGGYPIHGLSFKNIKLWGRRSASGDIAPTGPMCKGLRIGDGTYNKLVDVHIFSFRGTALQLERQYDFQSRGFQCRYCGDMASLQPAIVLQGSTEAQTIGNWLSFVEFVIEKYEYRGLVADNSNNLQMTSGKFHGHSTNDDWGKLNSKEQLVLLNGGQNKFSGLTFTQCRDGASGVPGRAVLIQDSSKATDTQFSNCIWQIMGHDNNASTLDATDIYAVDLDVSNADSVMQMSGCRFKDDYTAGTDAYPIRIGPNVVKLQGVRLDANNYYSTKTLQGDGPIMDERAAADQVSSLDCSVTGVRARYLADPDVASFQSGDLAVFRDPGVALSGRAKAGLLVRSFDRTSLLPAVQSPMNFFYSGTPSTGTTIGTFYLIPPPYDATTPLQAKLVNLTVHCGTAPGYTQGSAYWQVQFRKDGGNVFTFAIGDNADVVTAGGGSQESYTFIDTAGGLGASRFLDINYPIGVRLNKVGAPTDPADINVEVWIEYGYFD